MDLVAAHEENRIPPTIMWGTTPTLFDPSQTPPGQHTAFMWEKLPYAIDGDPANWDAQKSWHGRRMLDLWSRFAPNLEPGVILDAFKSSDIVIVHINPLHREKLPRTATEIMNRINEISFNSSLMREMRAISFVTKLIQDGKVNGEGLRHLLIHSISAEDEMNKLGVASKMNGDWGFLTHLRDIGREYAEAWLVANFDRLGKESTIDIGEQYL